MGTLRTTLPPPPPPPDDASSPIDPIIIFTRVAENGFARDVAVCGCLTRDPTFWGYLARVNFGQSGRMWLHAAAHLGHADRVRFLCGIGAPVEALIHGGVDRAKPRPRCNLRWI